jgi:broad-specificity NMP kinase
MKKIATNTLATLVLIGMMSMASVNVSAIQRGSAGENKLHLKRLERVYQHHDRKHELRASVLGISPEELRAQLKAKSMETVIKKHGFRNKMAFYTALNGKLKEELRKRGWNERKIEDHIKKRLIRLSQSPVKTPAFSV